MARNVITKTAATSRNPTAGTAITFTAADATNFDKFSLTGNGKEVLLIWNTHATTGYTYTIHSVADERGRTGDITTQAIVAGAIHVVGPLDLLGWQQTSGADSGSLQIDASNASVKWAIITLP